MLNYKKILLPIDVSQKTGKLEETAFYLAKQCSAGVVAVYVLPFPAVQAYQPNRAAKELMYEDAKKFLSATKERATKQGISLETKVLEGSPGHAIIDFAHLSKNRIDLIVIGSRNLGILKETFLGSVTNYVVHKSKIPVHIVK